MVEQVVLEAQTVEQVVLKPQMVEQVVLVLKAQMVGLRIPCKGTWDSSLDKTLMEGVCLKGQMHQDMLHWQKVSHTSLSP